MCFVYLVIFALGISGLDLLGNEITEFILLFVFGANVTGLLVIRFEFFASSTVYC